MANPKSLKPFAKGSDPRRNLKGRPSAMLPELIDLLAMSLNKESTNGKTQAQMIIEAMVAKARKGDVRAAEFLVDRGYGKAIQPIAMEVRGNITVDFTEL